MSWVNADQWVFDRVGYDDTSDANRAYRLKVALDRDARLTAEEFQAKRDIELEQELGPRWWLRAHP